jgi:hypothetical protein
MPAASQNREEPGSVRLSPRKARTKMIGPIPKTVARKNCVVLMRVIPAI